MLEKHTAKWANRWWRSPSVSFGQGLGKFLSLFCLCCFLAVSCGRQQTNAPGTTGTVPGRITIGITSKLRTIDPADAYEIAAGAVLYNLGDRLYTYELGTTKLKPELALELPKISPDGLTYTIPLREGVVFHDETPFNAEAMAFSLKRFIQNGGNPSVLLSGTVESVQATGVYELTIKLKKPFAAFPALLTFSGACAVSPKVYEIGAGKFKADTFVGTGPYKLAKYGKDSLKLDVFDKYWGEKPANKGIDIQVYSSPANLYNAFRTGAVDVAGGGLDLDQIASLQKEAVSTGWQAIEARSNGIYYLTLNMKDQPLDNVAVRQAIAATIDRPLLEERVFRGQIEPLYSLVPLTMTDVYKPVFKTQYGDGNTAKAIEALSKAGYSKDKPLKVELWYRSNLSSNAAAASTLKAAIQQKLGGAMELDVKSVEASTAYTNVNKGLYQMFMFDWSPDFFDADNYIEPFMACTKGSEATGCQEGATKEQGSFYYSDRVNQLIAKERQERNPETRKQIFGELQDILAKDVPFIPLWQGKEYLFAQKGVRGAALEPTQRFPFWRIQK